MLESHLNYVHIHITATSFVKSKITTQKYGATIMESFFSTSKRDWQFIYAKSSNKSGGNDLANKHQLVQRLNSEMIEKSTLEIFLNEK